MFTLLLLVACGGTHTIGTDTGSSNVGNDDTGTTTSGNVNDVQFSASNGEYDFNGDTVALINTENDVPGIALDVIDSNGDSVVIKDADGNILTETIATAADIKPGSYTVLFDYVDEYGIPMIGQITTNVSASGDKVTTTLCDDLSGDWHFTYEDDGTDAFDSTNVVMNGCSTQMNGIAVGNQKLIVTYNYASFENSGYGYDLVLDHTTGTIRAYEQGYNNWLIGTRE